MKDVADDIAEARECQKNGASSLIAMISRGYCSTSFAAVASSAAGKPAGKRVGGLGPGRVEQLDLRCAGDARLQALDFAVGERRALHHDGGEVAALENPFFRLYPEWALIPIVILATVATVIASQAVISGAFSLTRQAVQLGLVPRLAIRHTSDTMAGQIYLPRVNWLLLASVLFIVVVFRDSSHLAAAYGVSVTATMVITSWMAFFIIFKLWGWSLWKAAALIAPLLLIEQAFFVANMLKVVDGGWLPLAIAASVGLTMATWLRGSRILQRRTRKTEADLDWLIRKLEAKPPHRVPGTAVFLTSDINSAPTSLMHNLKHNRILHERNIVLSIKTNDVPRVLRSERVEIDRLNETFVKVTAHYGFMETPSIPKIFEQCRRKALNVDVSSTSFFLSRRSLRLTSKSEMPRWQDMLFIRLARSAEDATTYFRIPTDRVVEVGTQIAV